MLQPLDFSEVTLDLQLYKQEQDLAIEWTSGHSAGLTLLPAMSKYPATHQSMASSTTRELSGSI